MTDITRHMQPPGLGDAERRPIVEHDVDAPVVMARTATGDRMDGDRWTGLALLAAMVALALVAGLNYTFAVAVMPNLAAADDRTFVETMQRFNENPAFPASFTAALLLIVLVVVLERRHGPAAAVRWTVAALVLYAVVLAVTGGLHIPLNEQIDQAGDPRRIADLNEVRSEFEGPWVVGNIVRTVFCTAAVAALGRALLLHRRMG